MRDAARAGSISNTYWGAFEDYRQALTPTIAEAVALAFGWGADWADRIVGGEEPSIEVEPSAVSDQVAEAIAKLAAEFTAESRRQREAIERLEAAFNAERKARLAAVRAAARSIGEPADDVVEQSPRRP